MNESKVREYLQKGWIRSLVTFEVVGKPEKHVTDALSEYLANIRKDHRIVFLKEDTAPAEPVDDGLYSTFSEVELLFKDLETITWLCINFSPASIEIMEPDSFDLSAGDVQNWLNDLLSKVHEVGTNYRSHKSANEHLTIAVNQLAQNAIILSTRTPRTLSQIADDTGIHTDQLEEFIGHLVKKEKLTRQDDKYVSR